MKIENEIKSKMQAGVTTPRRPDLHHTPCKNPVIARPVRKLAVAIRIPRPYGPLTCSVGRAAPSPPPDNHSTIAAA